MHDLVIFLFGALVGAIALTVFVTLFIREEDKKEGL